MFLEGCCESVKCIGGFCFVVFGSYYDCGNDLVSVGVVKVIGKIL